MVSRQDIELRNPWWSGEYEMSESAWPKRDLYSTLVEDLAHPLIINVVGLRRVGKSTLLKQLIGHLLDKQQVTSKNIFYFLFDYASQLQRAEFLDEVLSFYFGEVLHRPGLSLEETVYVFLDEVQYIENWQAVLKRYYDLSGKKIKFIVTGSQSILLKGKSHESLAGRIFDYYLPPLSFAEFLMIHRESLEPLKPWDAFDMPTMFDKLSTYHAHHGGQASVAAGEYLTTGQFPESRQLIDISRRQEYIVESVFGKVLDDCTHIFAIEKTDEFKLFARHLLNNTASVFELANIAREIGISHLTLEKYLEYLKESYVAEVLYKYHKSLVKRGRLLKKLYTPCVNFSCALNHFTQKHVDEVPEAFGKIIENAVYNVLTRKYVTDGKSGAAAVSFWRQGEKEIDFLVMYNGRCLPLEVKFGRSVPAKDLTPLVSFIQRKEIPFGIVVTKDELSKKEINGKTLFFVPYYLILMMY